MPRHARALIALMRATLPRSVRDVLTGDIEELYRERVAAVGVWRSAWWLIGQTTNAALRHTPLRLAAACNTLRSTLVYRIGPSRVTLRQALAAPGFAGVVVLLVALGVGVNVTVFSLVDGILLTPMPYPDSDRIVSVSEDNPGIRISPGWTSIPNFIDWEERVAAFDAMALFRGRSVSVGTDGDPEYAYGARVSADFFEVFGVGPAIGRPFTSEETVTDGPPVVILAHGLWERGYGGDPSILGRSVLVDGHPHVVVGVMPAGFNAPAEWIGAGLNVALWRPFAMDSDDQRDNRSYSAVARLSSGTGLGAARLEVESAHRQLREAFPDENREWRGQVFPWRDLVVGVTRAPLMMLLGTMLLVLAIACANVASLTTTRILGRTRELATRMALGAGRGSIVAQVLMEALLLVGLGGILGIGVGRMGLGVLKAFAPPSVPRLDTVELDGSVLLFALAATALAALVVGGVAAALATRGGAAARLRGAGVGRSALGWRVRSSLAITQLVLSFALLAGATLLATSLRNAQNTGLGFQPEGVTAMTVALSWDRVATLEARTDFTRDVLSELRQIPGVASAAMINSLPLSGSRSFTRVDIEGRTDPENGPALAIRGISPGYHETLRIPVLDGRTLETHDLEAPSTAVINEVAADLHWPNANPIGERVRVGSGPWLTVVGVTGAVLHDGARTEVLPELYVPYSAETLTSKSFIVRTSGPPESITPQLREALRTVDPQQPIREIRSMEEWVARTTAPARLQTTLMAAAAGLATVLAGIGVFAALASVVRERRREIAVRVALGARKEGIARLVSRRALALVLPGLAGGAGLALVFSRLLEGFLFGVEPHSPLVLVLVAAALLLTAGIAGYVPTARALSLDPATVLREE